MSQPIITNEIENRLKLSGGTLTGSLFINNGYAYVAGNADESIFLSRRNFNDEKYSRYISISSKENIAIDSAINFVERNNDVWKTYKLYGEHNKPTAADVGALSLEGGTLTGKLGISYTGYTKMPEVNRTDNNEVGIVFSHGGIKNGTFGFSDDKPFVRLGDSILSTDNKYLYGEHNKPTPADIGAPTTTGSGATGTWPIGISGYAKGIKQQDTRSLNETPNTMQEGITLHLKGSGNDGLNDGGTYHASLHIKDWGDYSGGPFGQIALTHKENMWFRVSVSDSSWGNWKKVVTTPEVIAPGQGMPDVLALSLMNAGFGLHSDPEFSSGNNNVSVYNNSSNSTVTVTRTANSTCGNSTGYIMRVTHTGTASPGLGGFYQQYYARANAVFCQIFRAKIPVGYYVSTAANSMGTDYKDFFITSRNGTGKWEWYVRLTLCGQAGTYSSAGHVYLSAYAGYAAPSSSAPINWDISYCNVFDLTKGGSINAGMGADYTTKRARNVGANTSLSTPGNGEVWLVYT